MGLIFLGSPCIYIFGQFSPKYSLAKYCANGLKNIKQETYNICIDKGDTKSSGLMETRAIEYC